MKLSFVPAWSGLPVILAATLTFAVADPVNAGGGHHAHLAPCTTYETVERTIYVPKLVPETRIVHQTICEPEVRERQITVCRRVPESRQVTENFTVMVPQRRSRTVNYTVCKPVWSEVEQAYTVCIPQTETRTGTRTVCRPVQVQETQTVTRNVCVWEEIPCDGSCGGQTVVQKSASQKGGDTVVQKSPTRGHKHRVLRTHSVTEEVPVTVCKTEIYEEEYTYNVTTYRKEHRTRKVRVCSLVNEQRSREVAYTVCVPEQRTRTRNVTTYKTISEQKTQKYTVMVPRTVQKEITVTVCKMVPQQVTCQVPVYAPIYGCGFRHCCF
jgi:YTV